MSDPSLTTFVQSSFVTAGNGAAEVYANDANLAAAFGSLSVADNIANDKSPIIIGPWRGLVTSTPSTLFSWLVPTATHNWELELFELHVSPLPGIDGGYSGSGYALDVSNNIKFYVYNGASALADAGGTPLFANPTGGGGSVSLRLDTATNNVISEGVRVGIYAANAENSPNYLATISVLGYMRHRVA